MCQLRGRGVWPPCPDLDLPMHTPKSPYLEQDVYMRQLRGEGGVWPPRPNLDLPMHTPKNPYLKHHLLVWLCASFHALGEGSHFLPKWLLLVL